MKASKVIAIALISLSFAGCGKEVGGYAGTTDNSKTVKDDWKKLDPGRYAAMDDSSILRRWVEIDCTGTIKKEVAATGGLEALIASVAGKIEDRDRKCFTKLIFLNDAFEGMGASHAVVTACVDKANHAYYLKREMPIDELAASLPGVVELYGVLDEIGTPPVDMATWLVGDYIDEKSAAKREAMAKLLREKIEKYRLVRDFLVSLGISRKDADEGLARFVFKHGSGIEKRKFRDNEETFSKIDCKDLELLVPDCKKIRMVFSDIEETAGKKLFETLIGYMATPADEREEALVQIETFGQMYGIVSDFVKETVTEAEDAQTIFTNGSLDEEIRNECKRRRVALEPCSMMKGTVPRATFLEKMTNGSAVAQLGFEHFKRVGKSLSSSGFSGTLYRHGGMSDSVRLRGVEFAEKLARRILDLWEKGVVNTFKDEKMKQKFLFVQWRIARIAILRADQELRAGMVEQSSRSRQTAEKLDECNPALKKIIAEMEAARKRAMDGMSPREQLLLALRRADFESAREPAATVLEGDPDDVDANFALGMWHYQKMRWNEAEKHLLRCRDKKPRDAAVWNNLALVYMKLGKLDVAIQYARQALVLLPSSGEIKDTIKQIEKAANAAKALLNLLACCYAQEGLVEKSREAYLTVLAKDASNHEALMGLWRISLQEGALDKAKTYLERAVKAPLKEGTVRFDEALLHLMNNSLDEARLALAKITELHPRSIQGWALLAGVMLQQADKVQTDKQKQRILSEIDNVVLPKMESLAESPRDFFVLMTRALVLIRKGSDKETQKKTRAALELAWKSRPMVSVGAMVLDLDYRLLDRESAERHALQILRQDAGHAFANWVMGSIRMGQGKMKEAETYLRTSVAAPRPLAAAQNDLAEVLRQSGRLVEAEKYAREAKKNDPKLYAVWETLCATLLDQNKKLDEAEQCIQKAIELAEGKDIRMQLTLARVQLAKKEFVKARITLQSLDKHRDELTDRDSAVLDELLKKALGR